MKASSSPPWSIGQLARRFDLDTHVLRHWEDEGLLHPRRDASGYRSYDEADAVRVATILHERRLGMALSTIRTLLTGDEDDRAATLTAHREAIDAQIEALRVARDMTDHAIACEAHDVAMCPTFRSYVADLLAGQRPVEPLERAIARSPKPFE